MGPVVPPQRPTPKKPKFFLPEAHASISKTRQETATSQPDHSNSSNQATVTISSVLPSRHHRAAKQYRGGNSSQAVADAKPDTPGFLSEGLRSKIHAAEHS